MVEVRNWQPIDWILPVYPFYRLIWCWHTQYFQEYLSCVTKFYNLRELMQKSGFLASLIKQKTCLHGPHPQNRQSYGDGKELPSLEGVYAPQFAKVLVTPSVSSCRACSPINSICLGPVGTWVCYAWHMAFFFMMLEKVSFMYEVADKPQGKHQ